MTVVESVTVSGERPKPLQEMVKTVWATMPLDVLVISLEQAFPEQLHGPVALFPFPSLLVPVTVHDATLVALHVTCTGLFLCTKTGRTLNVTI